MVLQLETYDIAVIRILYIIVSLILLAVGVTIMVVSLVLWIAVGVHVGSQTSKLLVYYYYTDIVVVMLLS